MVNLGEAVQILQLVGILFGIAAFYMEYRKRGREQGYETYLRASLAYMELERWMIDHPDIERADFHDRCQLDPLEGQDLPRRIAA